MKTLQEMSTGHIIIDAFLLFVTIIAAFYLLYATIIPYVWLFRDTKKKIQRTVEMINKIKDRNDKRNASGLHSRVRCKQTEDLMNEIKKQS